MAKEPARNSGDFPWRHSALCCLNPEVNMRTLALVAVIGLYGGTQPAIMVEAAPLPVRCTAVALGYNITFGVIGGFTPLAATWLVDRTGMDLSPAFMIGIAAAVTLAALTTFRETAPARMGTVEIGGGAAPAQ